MSEPSATVWREAFSTFERLLELDGPSRERELIELAQSRPDLHPQVLRLIRADQQATSSEFLSGSALESAAGELPVVDAGSAVGPYVLERELGSGGMGQVWLARRADGLFEMPVALKLLHPHLALSAVRNRFVREGRILGQLTHPNVARLLDAGVAASGQLYLAIEYVEGSSLDTWCDQQKLGVEARLHLFLQICEAVAHAHAHLVVHRDLKPSNVLVTLEGNIKLLDFGIAKLVDAGETSLAQTELTHLGGRVLTPQYAAPEQVSGQPISVATDVYSLGVLLYILLSGRRPYGKSGDSLSQIEREVLETEPAPPSRARFSENDATELADLRNSTPPKLRATLTGDLDTIVLKALKKAPQHRYPSVTALAEDLQRYLDHLPVLAQPDSFAYRAKKYLRRHRAGAAAAAALTAAILAGVAGTVWQAQRAEQEALAARDHAQRVKRTKDFFVSIFESADPTRRVDGAPITLIDALDDALKRVDSDLADDPSLQGDLLDDFGEIKGGLGDLPTAKALFQRALPLHEQTLPPDHPAIANTLVNLGTIEQYMGNDAAGRPFLERAIAILEKHADSEGAALANARTGLANIYSAKGDDLQAARLMQTVLKFYRQSPGPQQLNLGVTLSNIGNATYHLGRKSEAKAYYEECVAVIERNMGHESPNLFICLAGLSRVALDQQDTAAAARYAERALAITQKNFTTDHRWVLQAMALLGSARLQQQRTAEGESLLRDALAMNDRLGREPITLIDASLRLAESRERAGDLVEARAISSAASEACASDPDASKDRCVLIGKLRARLGQQPATLSH